MKTASLTVRTVGQPERVFEVGDSETLIGRSATSHLRVADESISREHAVILFEDETYMLEDLQSTNGTRLNGKRVRSAELSDGDEIHIGQTLIQFRLG